MPNHFIKDPDSVLDYQFDWSSWLTTSESISTYALTVPSGITSSDSTFDSNTVTYWVSSGELGRTYSVSCKIDTSEGRTVERSVNFHIRNR